MKLVDSRSWFYAFLKYNIAYENHMNILGYIIEIEIEIWIENTNIYKKKFNYLMNSD